MYVRVFWGRVRLGMWDKYVRHYNEKVAPVSENMEGFRGRQLMQSTENPDEGASISLWDTLEDMGNYERSAERQRVAFNAQDLYAGEYWIKHFESDSWF